MKQNLLNKLWLRVWMIVAVMTTALAGTAWADTTYKLQQVTSVEADGLYVFEQDGYVMNNTCASSALQTTNEYNTSGLTGTETYVWTLEDAGSNTFYMKNENNTGSYPYLNNASKTNVTFGTSGSSKWSFVFQEDNTVVIENTSNSNRFLGYTNTTDHVYKAYATGNLSSYPHAIKVYQLVEEGGGSGGDSSLEDCDLALTGDPVVLNFDLYNNATAQTISYTTSSTGAVTIDENEYATFSIDEGNKTITVTPTTVTPSAQTITVNQEADDDYKAGSATFTITITDSTPIPTHTVTFSVNGVTSTQDFEEGEDITFPANPVDVDGKTFVGWVTEAIDGTTDDAPEFVTSATMGQNDVTYYAVFAFANGGGSAEVIKSYGFETESDPDWTINGPVRTANDANTGSYAGKISTNNTYVTFNSKVKVKEFSFAFKRTSNNNNYNVYIETSEDNTNWTAAETYAMSSFNNGSYLTKTKEFDGTQELYVRFHCYNTTAVRYVDDVTIKYAAGGVTYSDYCTTVVAAAVERPEITVAQNPFLFSTTATITCETEGATIKYSFDGETWNDYSEALTITATTTIYAKAVKNEVESSVASVEVTKNQAEPTVTIDATGITNTNVYEGTEAGSLAAFVTYNDVAVEGAAVTWSGNNGEVATIDENGAVTLVGAGTVTFTAAYAGNSDYSPKTVTYEMTVTNTDPNAPGTENNPYTVAEAIEATPASGTSANVYIHGFVSAFYGDDIVSDGTNYRYYVSDDGTTDNQLLVYRGKGLDNETFSSADDLQIGDEVVILGGLTLYKSTPEVAANNYIVSLVRVEKPEAPTFSVAAGTYTEAQSVELSTTTEGATIYYTIDGTEPTAESTEYTSAIEVTVTTTIKAIAVKDDVASDVATATYTINTTPSIELSYNEINAFAEGTDGVIIVTYNNITEVESEVFFCDADGNAATYNWVDAEFNGIGNLVYIIDANTSTEARTAYMKVYDNAEDVYSELITINQAGYVAPPTPGEWVETAIADLTFADVFVIVGNNGSTYALSNDNGTGKAPAAVEVEVVDNTLSGEIADNIKWTISGNATDGYTFYPYGSYDSWLYCINQNNGVRVGTNGDNKVFTFDGDYLYNTATSRYVGIYNSQDWRCYTSDGGNIADQTVKFYRKLTTSQTVTVGEAGYATLVAAQDLEIPSGVEVFTVEIRGEWAHLEPVTAGIPAGEAVVVKADEGEYVFDYATDAVEAFTVTNDLVAATAPVTADGTQYILAKPAGENAGFYRATEGTTIAVGKTYLKITGEAPVRGFIFLFDDDADAIENVQWSMFNGQSIFNLAGQRISRMQKGINIVNGKKVLK